MLCAFESIGFIKPETRSCCRVGEFKLEQRHGLCTHGYAQVRISMTSGASSHKESMSTSESLINHLLVRRDYFRVMRDAAYAELCGNRTVLEHQSQVVS